MQKKIKRPQQKSTKLKAGSLRKKHKIDKPLARFIKKQREKNQINKIRIEMKRSQQTTQKCEGS